MTASSTAAHGGNLQLRTHSFDSATRVARTEEQPTHPLSCGARTRAGAPCDRAPEPGRRRCRLHGGAPGTGAPPANTNARKHGRYSVRSRELRALGQVQIWTAELARAQLAVMNSCARGDGRGVEIAEQRVSRCMQRLLKAALVLDLVLVERGDEDGRRRLVEGSLRLVQNVCAPRHRRQQLPRRATITCATYCGHLRSTTGRATGGNGGGAVSEPRTLHPSSRHLRPAPPRPR